MDPSVVNPSFELSDIYECGKVVKVDHYSMRKYLAHAESVLGLSPKKYNFNLLTISSEALRRIRLCASSNYGRREFYMPPESHEALLLHESMHYVMSIRQLNVCRKIKNRDWYQTLINETFAETACGEFFGFRQKGVESLVGFNNLPLNELKRQEDRIEDVAANLEIKHRIAEMEYFCNKSEEGFEGFIDYYERVANDIPAQNVALFILALSNAVALVGSGTKTREMKDLVVESMKKKVCTAEFYFDRMVPLVRKGIGGYQAPQTTGLDSGIIAGSFGIHSLGKN